MTSWIIRISQTALVVGLLALAFTGGAWFERTGVLPNATRPPADSQQSFQVFWDAWRIVRSRFVDPKSADPQTLTYGAISGMVNALGDTGHSRFLTPDEAKAEQTSLSGAFSGIGAEVGTRDGRVFIVAPMEDSPAQKAGLRAGDVILKVDGQSVDGLTVNEVVNVVRGPTGSTVRLTVLHLDDQTSVDIDVVRAQIKVDSTTWAMVPGTEVALVRVYQFSDGTGAELANTLGHAREQGATSVILDLRNNSGGYLEEAVSVSSQLLTDGVVLIQRDARGEKTVHKVKAGGVATDIPLAVLIDQGTASAAEIVAGAIQDHQRGKLIGQTSFGAGTVLSTFALRDGSALLLGTAEWLTPNEHQIWKKGIEPDVKTSIQPGKTMLLPNQMSTLSAEQIGESGDDQLLKAIELLTGKVYAQTGVS